MDKEENVKEKGGKTFMEGRWSGFSSVPAALASFSKVGTTRMCSSVGQVWLIFFKGVRSHHQQARKAYLLISRGKISSIFVVALAGTTPELRGEGYVGTKSFPSAAGNRWVLLLEIWLNFDLETAEAFFWQTFRTSLLSLATGSV